MIDVSKSRRSVADSENWAKLGRRWVRDSIGSKERQTLTHGDRWRVEGEVYSNPHWLLFYNATWEVPRAVVEHFQTQ